MNQFTLFRRLLWVPIFVMATMFFSLTVSAAPTVGPSGMAFYSPPSPLPSGSHGDLIWYRTASITIPCAPTFNAWNVLYLSTDALGKANAVTGTVIVPKTLWLKMSYRPIISYAVGTHGLGQMYAPSIQLANGTDYENTNIAAALSAGYAVLVIVFNDLV